MKTAIHPTYHTKAKITCACGESFEIGSTVEKTRVELCSKCHPFYTGKQKFVDSARRVEKFKEKMVKKETVSAVRKGKRVKRATRAAKKKADSDK